MPTTTVDAVSEDAVIEIVSEAGHPLSTQEVIQTVADRTARSPEDVPHHTLRRNLAALEDCGALVASGGPKRDDRPGWARWRKDRRDVLWATPGVAAQIEAAHEAVAAQREREVAERADLLRAIHKVASPEEREELGLVGILRSLKADPEYREDRATKWSIHELRAIARMLGLTEEGS